MVVIATQFAQIEVQRHLRIAQRELVGHRRQGFQRRLYVRGRSGQRMPSVVERLAPTTQTRQRAEHRGEGRIKRRGQLLDLVHGLALQRVEQALLGLATQCGRLCQAAIDAYMTEVHVHVRHVGQLEHFQHQADDLEIA